MRVRVLGLVVGLVVLVAPAARASTIVGAGPIGDNGGYGLGFSFADDVNIVMGQAFTMGATAFLAQNITVWVNDWEDGASGASFTMQLMDAIGPAATAANVLYSTAAAFPDTEPPPGHLPVLMPGINVLLNAGATYYIVLSSDAGNHQATDANGDPFTSGHGWGTVDASTPGALVEPFATVGATYIGLVFGGGVGTYNDLNPTDPPGGPVQFLVDGIVPVQADVPEPASLLLLGGGLAVLARRRRHAAKNVA